MIHRLLPLALSLGLLASPCQARWGKLFYTPAERAAIEQDSPAATHRFDGEVRSSRGRIVRWIDGQPSPLQPPPRVRPGERWSATGRKQAD